MLQQSDNELPSKDVCPKYPSENYSAKRDSEDVDDINKMETETDLQKPQNGHPPGPTDAASSEEGTSNVQKSGRCATSDEAESDSAEPTQEPAGNSNAVVGRSKRKKRKFWQIFSCCYDSAVQSPPSVQASDQTTIRFFLAGSGEVGKSTVIKQLRHLCITLSNKYEMFDLDWQRVNPYTESQLRGNILLIHQNVFRIIGTLIGKVADFGLQYQAPGNDANARILSRTIGDIDTLATRDVRLTAKLAQLTYNLWLDDAIQEVWQRRRSYFISDSTPYFLDAEKLTHIASVDYLPTVDDVLRTRNPTRGAEDYNFKIDGVRCSFRDVGGQPIERAKWPGKIQDWLRNGATSTNFILYVASLADYNQQMEGRSDTRLDESIALLRVLLKIDDIRDTPFIVFLNKHDIFEEKLAQYNDYNRYANPYGRPDAIVTLREAEESVITRFHVAANEVTNRQRELLYILLTRATDMHNMDGVMVAVHNTIMNNMFGRNRNNDFR